MADIQVTNTDSDLSGNTLLTEEEAYTITGLHTYNRTTNPPFAVASGAAKVDNLDADKLDGQTGTYYLAAANATGTLSVAQGGTGATSLTDGGLLLGSGTGALTALGVAANGQIPIGDGSGDPQLATISGTSNQIDVTNGAASITLSLSSSYVGQTSITTLGTIATGTWEGTDIGVAHGGTGASSLTDGGILLGSGTGAITALGVATNGQIPIGDGSGDPVLATISGTSNQVDVTNGAGSITLSLSSSYVGQSSITTLGTIGTGTWEGTDVAVAHGGTGASSFTDNAILMGNGTGAVTPAHGISGYDSNAILKFQGAGAALYLTDTNSTRQLQITHQQNSGTTSLLVTYGSAASYGTGNNLAYLDTGTGEQTSLASGNNLKLTNFAGTEHMRLGPDGISFDGGTNDLDRYDQGTFTPRLRAQGTTTGSVTGTGQYIKVGDICTIWMDFSNVSTGASGQSSSDLYAAIDQLPDIASGQAGSIGTPATIALPMSGDNSVFYMSGSWAYFYHLSNNASWGQENFRDSTSGIYIRTVHTYKCL
jgi:hypothetical protein